jgi:hypothetical protein
MSNIAHQFADSNAFGAGPTPRGARNGAFETQSIVLDLGTDNLGSGDLWQFIRFNSRTAIYDVRLEVTQLDSDGTPALTIDLGYDLASGTDDDDFWLANSNIGQAGGAAQSSAAVFAPGEEFTVQAKVDSAAATAQAGQAVLTITFGPIQNASA